jgi:sterol desaturase/sphingolipid hydroxylase (fatty acid hydroxylase superfamily)
MDWSRYRVDWDAAYGTWVDLLRNLLTDPRAPFWWPTLLAAVVAAGIIYVSTRRHPRVGSETSPASSAYFKELPVDVLCLLGHTFTQAFMAPLLLLATIGGTALVIITFGMPSAGTTSDFATNLAVACLAFACGDFCLYWSHRLFHWLRPLWAMHKLHHQPAVLTPITAFRFWPPETAFHLAAFSVGEGVAFGIAAKFLGISLSPVKFAGINVFLVAWYVSFSHLRHSPVAMYFPRWLSFILVSPHMHQVHHSDDPGLHNRNFGTAFAVWDWIFGTLHIPRKNERFSFGLRSVQTGTDKGSSHA